MFRTASLSIIRSLALYTQQIHTGYADCLLARMSQMETLNIVI